ncbi:hypothetical protein P8452_46799 [Trifolium repens]|nr:hypothetical protein P8452_46799 [Trifolium repens]
MAADCSVSLTRSELLFFSCFSHRFGSWSGSRLVFGTTTGVVFRRRHRHSSSIRVGHDLSSGVSLLLDLCSGVFDLVLYTLLLLRATVNFFWQSQSSGGVIQTALLLLRSLFTVAIVVTIL